MKIDRSYLPKPKPKAKPTRHREAAPKAQIPVATVARVMPNAMRNAIDEALAPLKATIEQATQAAQDNIADLSEVRRVRQADAASALRRERSAPASVQAINAARWPRPGQR